MRAALAFAALLLAAMPAAGQRAIPAPSVARWAPGHGFGRSRKHRVPVHRSPRRQTSRKSVRNSRTARFQPSGPVLPAGTVGSVE